MFYTVEHGLKLCLVIAPVLLFATLIPRLIKPRPERIKALACAILFAFALVVAVCGTLGLTGYLSFGAIVAALWLGAGGVLAAWTRQGRQPADPRASTPGAGKPSLFLLVIGLISVTLLAGSLAAGLAGPAAEYDGLSYHLHFPTQWLVEERVFLIDTPFGDAAPAYAPAYGELWYAWLMSPMRGPVPEAWGFKLTGVDALARVGQFPFFLLLAASVIMLARRCGAESRNAYLPAVLLPFVPWILRQSASAEVDLMMGACLVAALAFAVEFREDGRRWDAALSGMALGFGLGVKYVALIYAPLVALPMLLFLHRRKSPASAAAWLGALMICGLPWYIRNLILTGNPLFPAHIAVGPWTLFQGAYDRAAMLESPFHVPDLFSALGVSLHAVGPWMAPLCLGGVITGILQARKHRLPALVFWIAPVAMAWHFLAVPYSSQDRFLIWVAALSLAPLAWWPSATGQAKGQTRGRGVFVVLIPPLLLMDLFAPSWVLPFGKISLPLRGLVEKGQALPAAATLGAAVATYILCRRRKVSPGSSAVIVFLAAFCVAFVPASATSGVFVRNRPGGLLQSLPLEGYGRLWALDARSVAYAGRNAPFYLAGRGGATRVSYINPDGRGELRLHHYVWEAVARGDLDLSREKDNWRGKTPDPKRWAAALKSRVEYLFLEPMSPWERRVLPGDAQGYPRERVWAQSDPEGFHLLAKGEGYEIYKVNPAEGA